MSDDIELPDGPLHFVSRAVADRLRGVLLEIASGHPDPVGHARRFLEDEARKETR